MAFEEFTSDTHKPKKPKKKKPKVNYQPGFIVEPKSSGKPSRQKKSVDYIPPSTTYSVGGGPTYTSPPSYSTQKKNVALEKFQKPQSLMKPAKNLSSLISDLKSGIDAPASYSPLADILRAPLEEDGEKPPEIGPTAKLIQELKNLGKPPEGYDPFYDKDRKVKYDSKGNLKEHWNDDFIANTLQSFREAGDDFNLSYHLNQYTSARFDDKEEFIQKQNDRKLKQLEQTIEAATQGSYDGDFGVLKRKIEEDPNFRELLEPKQFNQIYGITPAQLRAERDEALAQAKNFEEEADIHERYTGFAGVLTHYKNLNKKHRYYKQRTSQILENYEKKFNKNAEIQDVEDVQAIPPVGGLQEQDYELLDNAAMNTEGSRERQLIAVMPGLSNRERKIKIRESIRKEKDQLKEELGLQSLPSVRKMLRVAVLSGQLDPNDEAAVEKFIWRYKNPSHRETRSMYAQFAVADLDNRRPEGPTTGELPFGVDKAFDRVLQLPSEREERLKELLPIINQGVEQYIEDQNEIYRGNRETEKREALFEEGDKRKYLVSHQSQEILKTGDPFAGTGISQTFDILMRPLNTVAGVLDAINQLDEDSYKEGSWAGDGNFAQRTIVNLDPTKWTLGKSTFESADDLSVEGLKEVGQRAYSEFFRGSNLPGVDPDQVPTLMGHVIANNAAWDERENIYDSNWYQNTMGFIYDVVFDPLNFIGVGAISKSATVGRRAIPDQIVDLGGRRLVTEEGLETGFNVGGVRLNTTAKPGQRLKIYDPYQNIGLGSVDDIFKLPVQATDPGSAFIKPSVRKGDSLTAGALRGTSRPRQVSIYKFSQILDSTTPGEVVQQGMLRLQDDLNGIRIGPTIEGLTKGEVSLRAAVGKLKAQEQELLRHIPDEVYRETIEDLTDIHVLPVDEQLRVERIIGQFEGEKSGYQITKIAENDMMGIGMTNDQYHFSASIQGREAKKAQQQMVQLESDAKKMNLPESVYKEQYDQAKKTLDDALKSGEANTYTSAKNIRRMVRQNPDVVARYGLREKYMKAMNWKGVANDFPFSDSDILESLIIGPRFQKWDDPRVRDENKLMFERVQNSRQQMDSAPGPDSWQYRNAQANLQDAYKILDKNTYAASVRYLNDLQTSRADGVLWSNKELAQKLGNQRARLKNYQPTSALPGSNIEARGTKSLTSVEREEAFTPEFIRKDREGQLIREGEDVYETPYMDMPDEILADGERLEELLSLQGFKDKEAAMNALDRELISRMRELKLGEGDFPTKLSPREAHDMAKRIPSDYKDSTGKLDPEKLRKMFEPPSTSNGYRWRFIDKIPEDHVDFLNIVKQTLNDEYTNLYPKAYEWYQARFDIPKDQAAREYNVKQSQFHRKYGSRPEIGEPLRSLRPGSEWDKKYLNGLRGWQEVRDLARQSPGGLYKVAYSAGAPIKFNPPARVRLPYKGEMPDKTSPSSLRDWAMKRTQVDETFDEYLEEYAQAMKNTPQHGTYEYLNRKAQVDAYLHDVSGRVHDDLFLRPGTETEFLPKADIEDPLGGKPPPGGIQGSELVSSVGRGLPDHEINKLFKRTWDNSFKAAQKEWDKLLRKAKEADAELTKGSKKQEKAVRSRQMPRTEKNKARDFAIRRSYDKVTESLIEHRTLPQLPGNTRLTLQGTEKSIKSRRASDRSELRMRQGIAKSKEEVIAINSQRKAMEKEYEDLLKNNKMVVQAARYTEKVLKQRLAEERILQLSQMPAQATERVLQLRIAGMRKNLEFTKGLFRGAEAASGMNHLKSMESYQKTFTRPTKQMDHVDSAIMWAKYNNVTPAVIAGYLKQFNKAFDGVDTDSRKAMLTAFRNKVNYQGKNPDKYAEVKKQFQELEKIWSKQSEAYHYVSPLTGGARPLNMFEINHFLAKEHKVDVQALMKSADKRGNVTLDQILKASTADDLNDPYRLLYAHTLAANQAFQLKALKNTIMEGYGKARIGVQAFNKQTKRVEFTPSKTEDAKLIERLKEQGWETVDWLDNTHYFPPEALKDIRTLERLTQPEEITKFGKMVDKSLGWWKQSMTIYNPGYYSRNGVGEIMAAWLDGVNDPMVYKQARDVMRWLKAEGRDNAKLMQRWSALAENIPLEAPTKASQMVVKNLGLDIENVYRGYVQHGLKSTFANTDIERGVRSIAGSTLSDSKAMKLLKKQNETVHDFGEGFEDWLRLGHFIHALKRYKGKDTEKAFEFAAERVRKYHFDYADFSKAERISMLRAFPFYKWTRRGAPLMLAHLAMTPGKMMVYPKIMNYASNQGFNPMGVFTDDPILSTQDIMEDKNGVLPNYSGIAPVWVRDLFAYQMGGFDQEDEYAPFFRLSTPMIDGLNALGGGLGAALDPKQGLEDIIDQGALPLLNPYARVGIEQAMNQGLSMDKEMQFPIRGGDYNKQQGINPVESTFDQLMRNIHPVLGGATQASKNNQLPFMNMGDDDGWRKEHGYNPWAKPASLATGMGFYQGINKQPETEVQLPEGPTVPGVGSDMLRNLPKTGGGASARKQEKGEDGSAIESILGSLAKHYDEPSDEGGSSGYGFSGFGGFKNFGYGGYGYGGSSGSYISGGSSGSLFDLLQSLKRQIDQGQVIDDA